MSDGGEHEIKDFSSVLGRAFDGLSTQDARRAGDAFAVWRKVLLGIRSSANPNEGANLAAHSRIVDLKNGVLLVEADHPGWIELLQLRKQFILKGLSFYARDMQVQTLAFRLAGRRGDVGGADYSAREARGLAEGRVEREEAALARWNFGGTAGQETDGRTARAAAGGNAPRHGTAANAPASMAGADGQQSRSGTDLAPELAAALSALKRDMGA